MNKPNNFDNTPAGGDYEKIALGPHSAVIKELVEEKSSSGKPMIVVYIDFDDVDSQPKLFTKKYKEDQRTPKKWPYQAVQHIVSEDADGNTTRSFKSFCTAYEKSNNATIQWGDSQRFVVQFKNKRIGVVYGEEESDWNGKVTTRPRIRYFCDIAKLSEQQIPEKKTLRNGSGASSSAADSSDTDWMFVPDAVDDEGLPFR